MPLLTPEQIAATIIKVGNEMGVSPKGQKMAIACVKVESNFLMWANAKSKLSQQFPYDRIGNDSLSEGYYQQQPPWWGGADYEGTRKRMDLVESTRMFFESLKKQRIGTQDYNTDATTPGLWVYMVQRCAPEYKHRYDQEWNAAVALYNKVNAGGSPDAPAPFFPEHNIIDGKGASNRNGQRPRLFVLHTEEGNMVGADLDRWMDEMGDRSYHYAISNDEAWDLVDTDYASWSVLDANRQTINLVFTPSYAAWTRNDWLAKMGNGIKIAAYLAAQDCRKYGIPPVVRVGNSATGYPSLKTNDGITDHYGITVGLKIGNHTDVGGGFPWDVFNTYLQAFYAGSYEEDDMFTDSDRALLQRVHFELTNRWESRSIYREPGEGPVDTLVGMLLNDDGMEHAELVERLAVLGDFDSIRRVRRTAAGKGAVTDKATVARAKKVMSQIPEDVLEEYMKEADK
ncbi:lysin A [Mycobacterium phage Skinny]|uniref:Lysin A n=6 Tax=Bongovirus bongo TaxID=1983750 RepID=A0A0M5M0S9_9CAUD|nr:endolysin [Mycobacterium phage PegLeg]YP_009604893.1 endolysin [Mycobacterium phage Bongo]ALF00563.1 lysin A [Mycobacterium phage Bricole]AXQ52676.1 lysin A [Mycobacterium phage IPhane7]QDH93608.1 lysin A [Mycobacterium phage LilhomieP]QGJ93182.1 lysin A [Mycobacterium phage TyDawg]UXE05242.1 lysin A [Mycobacterium phage Skinny]